MEMVCKKCGTGLPGDALFCEGCGNRVADVKKKKKKKRISVLRGFLSSVCCLFIFFMVLLILMVSIVRGSVKKGIAEDIVDGIEITGMVESEDVGDFVEELTGRECSAEEIELVMEKIKIKDAIAKKIDDYAEGILDGERPEFITKEDVIEWVAENEKTIERELDCEITYDEYVTIDSYNFDEYFEEIEENDIIDVVSELFSVSALITLYIIAAIFLLLLVVIRRRLDVLVWNGITLIAVGLLAYVPIMGVSVLKNEYFDISVFIEGIMATINMHAILTVVIGVVCIITYILMKKFIFKKRV